jgi:hypothetical protein
MFPSFGVSQLGKNHRRGVECLRQVPERRQRQEGSGIKDQVGDPDLSGLR